MPRRPTWSVFEQVGHSYAANHSDSIRRMMTQATVSACDRRARLVGEDVYVAAGGRIERDLFSDETSARWLDVALLERLACEKMEALASHVAGETGLAFVRPTLDSWIGPSHVAGLRRVPAEAPPLTDEEAARVDALEAEIEAIAERLQSEKMEEAEREQSKAELRDLDERVDAIVDKRPVIDEALKP